MPATYAHYRFGAEMLPKFPEEAQSVIRRNRALYDMGTHGPDIFFFHNPFKRTAIVELGYRYHRLTGKVFFERTVRSARLHRGTGGLAYLYGVLTHYALDSLCHPPIRQWDAAQIASHAAIESEFDRLLLELDGKRPPHAQDLSLHMKLSAREEKIVAGCYGAVKAGDVITSLRNQYAYTKLLCTSGFRRKLLRSGMKAVAPGALDMLVPDTADKTFRKMDMELLEHYHEAAMLLPRLAEHFQRYLDNKEPLGEAFSLIFG